MFKNNFSSEVKIGNERRLPSRNTNLDQGTDDFLSLSRPLSLSAGPLLTWLNAIGDKEAQAIVDEYRPRFRFRYATREEMDSWQ